MSTLPPQVFISYHRTDGDVARHVRDHLVVHGVRTWMDEFDIPVGAYWPDEIDKGLTNSDIVVGVLSPDAVASRNVKNEWDWAIQNDKRLLLLQVQPCVIPHRYVSINFIDVTVDLEAAVATLLKSLGVSADAASTATRPETQYARSGDVSIAYQVLGTGPMDLVWVPGLISNVDAAWEWPEDVRLFRLLSSFTRLIRFDKRGTGLSDRVPERELPTLEQRMDDVRAVMDAVGCEQAALLGVSDGGPMYLLFAATYPERVHALILVSSMVKGTWAPDYPWVPTAEEFERYYASLRENWGSTRPIDGPLAILGSMPPAQLQRWAQYSRACASPGAVVALERMNAEIDVRHVLPAIRVPTLIVHHTDDTILRVEEGRYLAEHIAGARYLELPGDGHGMMSERDVIATDVEAFLASCAEMVDDASEVDTVLSTVLVLESGSRTDIGSGMSSDPLRAALQRELERARGRAMRDASSALVATFDGPVRAIRCARAMLAVGSDSGVTLRAGLHTGEIEVRGDTVQGLPLQLATELASLADPGEVVVTSTVKDLVAGSGFRFEERGSQVSIDLPEEWGLFVVDQTSVD